MPWFDSFAWLIILAPFVGLFASALAKRRDPFVKGDRVYRHDVPARVSHWTHALGVAVCLISGIVMGLRFTPAFVADGPDAILWMNVHFVACVSFLFGTFFYVGNTIISRYRFKEHLPTSRAIQITIQHYGHKFGIKKFDMPAEDKYYESEKLAYIMALGCSALLIVSGLIKALAHMVLTVPDSVLNITTWVHDISAVLMLLFFLAHVFFAAVMPFAWKTFPSMLIGWMPRSAAEEDHKAWMAKLVTKGAIVPEDESSKKIDPAATTKTAEAVSHD